MMRGTAVRYAAAQYDGLQGSQMNDIGLFIPNNRRERSRRRPLTAWIMRRAVIVQFDRAAAEGVDLGDTARRSRNDDDVMGKQNKLAQQRLEMRQRIPVLGNAQQHLVEQPRAWIGG
jgi:hypothetical protein